MGDATGFLVLAKGFLVLVHKHASAMRLRNCVAVTIALTISWMAGVPIGTEAAEGRTYILATATNRGTYYPVGVGLATLVKIKLEPSENISLAAISSAGSGENLKLLREDQAQFAILQGLFGAWAWHGEGGLAGDGPQRYLRSVTMLWHNVEHFILHRDYVATGTIEDVTNLAGEKFSIGQRNSGTEGSGLRILEGLGIDAEASFDIAHLGYGPSAEALQNGTIKGMNAPAGVPVTSVAQAFAALGDDIAILGFTQDQMNRVNGGYNLWFPYVIDAETYPGQTDPVTTIAQPNFLAVRDDVDSDAVYRIIEVIYENLSFLNNIHRATRAMDIAKAVEGLPIPLHPGAARFYRDNDIPIPAHLEPE